MTPRRAQLLGEYNRFMGLGETAPTTTTPDGTTPTATTPIAPFVATGGFAQYFTDNPNMKYVAGAAVLALVYFLWPRR